MKDNKHASHEQIKKEMMGHNRLQENPELKEAFKKLHKLCDDTKAINDAKKEIVASLKEKFSLAGNVVRRELQMQRMEKAARVQLEESLRDIKIMVGTQLVLDLHKVDSEGKEKNDPVAAAKEEAAKNPKKDLKAVK